MVANTPRSAIPRSGPRNGNIDVLRLIAAIGVIALHVGPFPELSQTGSDLIRSSFRWCVPFFFMLTGYYLLGGGGGNDRQACRSP
ncbi:acyltransferase family protein [Paracoccus sp. R86501]|uniref:acyltransferase family protein n=1 Tax=Paracoccus sp. R86501 TaxID=3101711 RepID=UPI00367076B4